MEALDWVFNALDGARVELSERKIIWPDGQSLSIEQCVDQIRKDSGLDSRVILNHVIGWLQLENIPEELDEDKMERFENQIDPWVEEFENRLPLLSDC